MSIVNLMLSDEPTHYRLTAEDLIVGAIRVSQSLTLEFHDSDRTYLQINGVFSIHAPRSQAKILSVDQPTTLSTALSIIGDRVRELSINKASGDLVVCFVSGSQVHVPSHEMYESWELYNSRGLRLIALPGGQVAYWSASTVDGRS